MFKDFPIAKKVDDEHIICMKCWSVFLMGAVVISLTTQQPEESHLLKKYLHLL